MSTETHKSRKHWYSWHGKPSTVAAIARDAGRLVGGPSSGVVTIKVDSPAWESNYESVEDFEEGIRASDLPDVRVLEIEAAAHDERSRITIKLTRSTASSSSITIGSKEREPVAELHIAGDDRNWVAEATQAMAKVIPSTTPRQRGIAVLTFGGLVVVVSGIVILGSFESSPTHEIGVGIAITGGVMLAIGLLSAMVVPAFELIPDGEIPRRAKIGRRLQAVGAWLAREAISGMIGFALGVGTTLLWQRFS